MSKLRTRPERAICIECGEDYPLYMFGMNAKSPTGHNEMCQECSPPAQYDLVPTLTESDWGVTVTQNPETIAAAWQAAMGQRKFTSLAFKRHTIAGRVEP